MFDTEKTQAPPRVDFAGLKPGHEEAYNECGTAAPHRLLSDEEAVAELFKYHPPNISTISKYAAINQAAKNFAEVILQTCPAGADRSDAIRKIREARMTANAAVALNGLSL